MKIDTTTVLLIAVAAGAIYFMTRPPAVTPPYPYPTTAYNPYLNPAVNPNINPTAQDISAGGQAAGTVINALSNLWG